MRERFLAACIFATAMLTPLGARAAGVDPDAATPVQREQAQARFERGRQLFAEKKFDQALLEFTGSHDIVASPNARLYMAYCHRQSGALVTAYEEFGRAATEAKEHAAGDPRYAKAAESAVRERDALAPKLAFVTITVAHAAPETKLTIAGEEIKSAAWSEEAPVLPGTAEIVAETPGRPIARASTTVAAGEHKTVAIDAGLALPAPPPPPEPQPAVDLEVSPAPRTAAYVASAVGVAGLATFAVFGLMAKSSYDTLQSECRGACSTNHDDQVSAGKSQQTVANVGLVVGAVGAVAGVTLFVLSRPAAKRDAPTAAIVAEPAWLGVRGAF